MKIVRATDPELLGKIFRLRYTILCEDMGEFSPGDYPDGKEMDEYDRYAEQYAIFNRKGEFIGCFRLIYRTPIGLPAVKVFGLDRIVEEIGEKNICEISRIFIKREHRSLSTTLDLFTRIMVFGCIFMRKKKMTHALCAVEESLYRLLRISHAPFEPVGDPKPYNVRLRFPLLLSMKKMAEAQPKYCRYCD